MKRIDLIKAMPIGSHTVEGVQINIFEDVNLDEKSLDEIGAIYEEQAEKLIEALWNSLPGGTIDRLTIKLLQRKVSYFIIPFADPNQEVKQ